ncbi:vasorin a [Oncorhynchus nerka]|uniref:vasorin a n=1 Tax=Oncorhynchus nerka TaxID=8023 RepID=UPI0031B891A5
MAPFLPLLLLLLSSSSSVLSSDCPEDCSCQAQGSIFCIQRRSPVVPRDLPSSVKHLYVFQNGINTLAQDDFTGLGELEMLDLSQNKLTEVPDGVFETLSSLRNLDLSANYITHIAKDSFSGLMQLERLYLHGNRIKSIQSEAFEVLEDLLELKLQGNQLTGLPMLRLPRLLLLDLSFNSLPTLGPQDLQTPHLESLKVAALGLTTLDSDLMASLGNLHDLDVSQNQLEGMPEALKATRGLIKLSLAANPIGELRNEDFQSLVGLHELDLSGLNLQGLPQGFFQLFPRLGHLTVAENPFNCLCPLAWFPGWLKEKNVDLGHTEETRCHFPPVNAGKVLAELDHQDFGCPPTTTVMTNALGEGSTSAPPIPTTSPGNTHTNAIPPPPPFPSDEPSSTETDIESRPPPPASPTTAFRDEGHICPPNICLNGGTCRFDPLGQLGCLCPHGTMGLYCENLESYNHNQPPLQTSAPEVLASMVAPIVTSDPNDISSRQVTSTSILLDLHRFLETRPHIRGIKLTYRNLSGPDRRPMSLSVPASYPEYTLRGLRPNCTYSVCASPLAERVNGGGGGGGSPTEGGSCMEARTEGGPQASSLEPHVDDQSQLTYTLIPALAALALVTGVAVVAILVLFLRRRRAHMALEGGEMGPMELEGLKACLENGVGNGGTLPHKGADIAPCHTSIPTQPQNGGSSQTLPQNGGLEYEAPLMKGQGHCPSNNNVASLKPSYF